MVPVGFTLGTLISDAGSLVTEFWPVLAIAIALGVGFKFIYTAKKVAK